MFNVYTRVYIFTHIISTQLRHV